MTDAFLSAAARIREWREDPCLFVREQFGTEPDAWQRKTLEAATKNIRLALKACKGPGKSCVLAWIIWWWLVTRPHPKVVATSITGDNLADGLWTELAKWQQKSEFLKAAFTWTATRIFANDHPETWWASARTWAKGADPSQQANTLAGIHADHVLFVIDEAGGVPDAVVAAAEAGLANISDEEGREAKLIIAGNPTHLDGPLYRACTRERHLWWVMEISSDPDDPDRTPRVSVQWAKEQIEKYGRDHPFVLVNVLGKFPPGQANTLIAADDASKASQRTISEAEFTFAPKILGVDVARFGDDRTVLQPRQGKLAMRARVLRNLDTMEVAGQVAQAIAKWQPDAVFIDQTGIGAGVVDRLRELGHQVVGVDSASRPRDPHYLNLRAEMWAEMRDWLAVGGCIPDDGELVGELSAPTYKFTSEGRLQLEGKADMKKRGVSSPDKADALALTFAYPVPIRTALDRARGDRNKAIVEEV